MKYRKLRIAWSVAWGVACLVVIALWVRSYSRFEVPTASVAGLTIQVVSSQAKLAVPASYDPSYEIGWLWQFESVSDDDPEGHNEAMSYIANAIGVGYVPTPLPTIVFPDWLSVLLSATLATAPWLPCRIGLGTLLIGMTVAAIGLGLAVYAHRQ